MSTPKQLDLFNQDGSEPPSTNRGVTVSIHWLSLTCFTDLIHPAAHLLREMIGVELEDDFEWSEHFFAAQHGARGYKALYFGPEGIRLYAFPYSGKHCHLEIPGKLIELYGNQKILDYLKSLYQQDYETRCIRIDIAFDHSFFTPEQCYEAHKEGLIKAKCNKDSWDWRQNIEGNTLYIGSRKSERFVRIYDRRGFTRLEMVFKHRWAKSLAEIIIDIGPSQWIAQLTGFLRDFIEVIINTNKEGNWWLEFIGNAHVAKLKVDRKTNDCMHDKLNRFLELIGPRLFILRDVYELDLNTYADSFEFRLNTTQQRKLELLRKHKNQEK